MLLTVKELRETGNPEQLKALDELVSLGKREIDLVKAFNEADKPYREEAEKERKYWGFNFAQIADLVVEHEIYPEAKAATATYERELEEVRNQMRDILERCVQELEMKNLGIIQRHYKNYVGEQLPD